MGEIYHVYSRGVEKRDVFTCGAEYERFQLLLLLSNRKEKIHIKNLPAKYQGESLISPFSDITATHANVDVLAYAFMPNHFHLILHEKRERGISIFMHKLMTAYSMYFNIKNERSGPLFTRPFRSRHVHDDDYFRWLFAYVHLNPLELSQPEWKAGRYDLRAAQEFMREYAFSSFSDFFVGDRAQSSILNKEALPSSLDDLHTLDALLGAFSAPPEEYQGESLIED